MDNKINLATIFEHPETLSGHKGSDKVLVTMTWCDLRMIRAIVENAWNRQNKGTGKDIGNGTKDTDSGQGEET